jgi:hypothetical protein
MLHSHAQSRAKMVKISIIMGVECNGILSGESLGGERGKGWNSESKEDQSILHISL